MKSIRNMLHLCRFAHDRAAVTLFTIIARLRFALLGVRVGPGFRASGWICLRIHPASTVSLGRNCRMNSGTRINLVGSGQRVGIYASRNACLAIGDRVGISNSVVVATESISIGSDTLIGGGCMLVDSDLHSLPLGPHVGDADPRRPRSRSVQIGSCVFIGAHSIVLKGSCIGDGAIVGAGSVIAGVVEPHTVVVSPHAQAIGLHRAIVKQGGVS
jgi:acetyltransferase-like isoleucine patch superfamily enzyme